MIKEWYYETFINGKRYRVDCVESSGYGGSRIRTQKLVCIDEDNNEKTLKVFKKSSDGEEVEKRRKNTNTASE